MLQAKSYRNQQNHIYNKVMMERKKKRVVYPFPRENDLLILVLQSILYHLDIPTKRKHPEDETKKGWQDVVGQEDAKRALFECCILPSILPSYLFVGIRQLCMTILLYGPPGTGKTTLVHVVAHESRIIHVFLLE